MCILVIQSKYINSDRNKLNLGASHRIDITLLDVYFSSNLQDIHNLFVIYCRYISEAKIKFSSYSGIRSNWIHFTKSVKDGRGIFKLLTNLLHTSILDNFALKFEKCV